MKGPATAVIGLGVMEICGVVEVVGPDGPDEQPILARTVAANVNPRICRPTVEPPFHVAIRNTATGSITPGIGLLFIAQSGRADRN